MKKLIAIPLGAILALSFSCKDFKKGVEDGYNDAKKEAEEVKIEAPEENITLSKLEDSPAYSDAVLRLENPSDGKIAEAGPVDFNFTVSNYELGAQTDSPNANLLANSGKGQHIHFILNNEPYSAHYESTFTKEMPAGVHHLVAFLSRSYHESVKNENSVVVQKLEIGENPEDSKGIQIDAPTLIYSRPKGEYSGKDTENLLLDFFVLNTTLSADGNKVKATINGQEFMITEWAPHVIKGLNKGEVTIKLELIDQEGNGIPGPFNTVERTVTLKE
ncbi:hypothetical protein [Flavobacterium sp. ASW18X]|uniref:hypothetical protein n=1 Tax=Flavobacterium sp. ASW18X TaxID=2572595 RepID=UPI0010AE737E|nr:hypothetical protein [Flavobacterium sp. ASW18X]TKD62581.1 hypothetical protein FBT53_10125 [Flavobacterium sp. ASW18X]